MSADTPGALKPLRVLDLSQGVSGGYCTKLMAGFGAEVIKVEPPGTGDTLRSIGPFWRDEPNQETGCLYLHLGTGKKSVTLDITRPEGAELVRRLVPLAHAVIESSTPGFMEEHGLGYDDLRELNPSLVMTSITPFGQTGPYSKWKGNELVSYAMGGYAHVTGLPDREPVKGYGYVVEYHAGLHAAVGTLAALWRSYLHGMGEHVDVSVQDTVAYVVDQPPLRYRRTGLLEKRVGSRNTGAAPPPAYFSQLLPVADGYIHVHSPTSRAQQSAIGELIGEPRWMDPAFKEELPPGTDMIEDVLAPKIRNRTRDELMWKAQAVVAPWASVLNVAEVLADPQHEARGFFTDVEHPVVGRVRQPDRAFIMEETPWRTQRAPMLGEHTGEVLGHLLGLGKGELSRLRKRGVV